MWIRCDAGELKMGGCSAYGARPCLLVGARAAGQRERGDGGDERRHDAAAAHRVWTSEHRPATSSTRKHRPRHVIDTRHPF